MTDGLLADATAALAATMQQAEGRAVTYSRGDASVAVTAWRSFSRGEIDDGTGVLVLFESWDWLLELADLADLGEYGGATPLPAAGDRITDADGTVYEAAAPAGVREWQWAGPAGTLVRVHTKRLGEPA